MPITRLVNLNSNTGAWTLITAAICARSAQIIEDGSVTPQGIELQFPKDGFATTNSIPYGQQPVTIAGEGNDGLAGLPAQGVPGAFNYRPADTYCQARSLSATATVVRVIESETEL